MDKDNLPTIQDLTSDLEASYKNDQFNQLMSNSPKKEWIKEHPFVPGWMYIPIDKVEYLLKKIFKRYKIEITGQGVSFNGVWVSVRVHYFHPINNEWLFHDGIGACQLQTKKGTSPADLININNGAIAMAFPIAKTLAVKDACDHFGDLFGANLNRKDVSEFKADKKPITFEEIKELWDLKFEAIPNDRIADCQRVIDEQEKSSYNKLHKYLLSL